MLKNAMLNETSLCGRKLCNCNEWDEEWLVLAMLAIGYTELAKRVFLCSAGLVTRLGSTEVFTWVNVLCHNQLFTSVL